MSDLQAERPAKRFKHQSYKETLKEVHLPSALNQTQFDRDISDNDSHFNESLNHWRELNLSPAFLQFADKSERLSASMPLLLHNWTEILELWFSALDVANDEGLKPLLDLLQNFLHDLRATVAPMQSRLLERLLKLLPRSLSAPSLIVLLETFSALFKYVLIPLSTMDEAWSAFQGILPKCNPEVQRAVAEVWGSALRRLKLDARQKCVVAIASTAHPDVCSWTFVTACKSVSQTLHTVAPTIFSPLLQYYLSCQDAEDDAFTVLRRLLTALIHHCKTAEQFSPFGNILVDEVAANISADAERLRRMLEVATVACSVRQGSRLTAKQLSTLLSQFSSLPLDAALHSVVLKFTTACLTAGDMALWMGPGRKVLEKVWERPVLGLELCGALSDLGWGGWKLMALPHVLRMAPKLLESQPSKTLDLLCALHREGKLSEVDVAWKRTLQAWVDVRFSQWNATEERLLELSQVLALSDLLPSNSPVLVKIIQATLETSETIESFRKHATNSAWVLGSCLTCLSHRSSSEWSANVDLLAWTNSIVEKWGWSGYALDGLVRIICSSSSRSSTLGFDVLYSSLQSSLLSHSRLLRLSTLRLLSSPIVNAPASTAEVVKRCLQAEQVSIDVPSVRERVLKITRLGQVLRDDDDVGAAVSARWLTAQLKVNLRPLWSPTSEALASLAERFPEVVWSLVFKELQDVSPNVEPVNIPHWLSSEVDESFDTVWEEERTWRDPSAHKLRSAVAKWLREDTAHRAIVKAQLLPERFDTSSYEAQLLSTLAECPSLAERYSRDLVPHFLSSASPEAPTRMPRPKLTLWLTLFSKFKNPKALRSTEHLHSIYITLLSHPDRPLQRLALSCLFTYKSPRLLPREDSLRSLLDDTRWRDELTQLDVAEIKLDDREELVNVIVRLLFGMMLEKRGRTRGADRRAAVLGALGGCTDQELLLLVDLMLGPINKDRERHGQGGYVPLAIPDSVSAKQLVGFLTLLGDVVKNLGSRLLERWPVLLETLLDIVAHAQNCINRQTSGEGPGQDDPETEQEEEVDQMDDVASPSRNIRTVRQLGLKRFADFFRAPVTFDFTLYLAGAFHSVISPRLESLDVENTQSPSTLLELFHVWSSQPAFARFLVQYDSRILPKVYNCLTATNVKQPVISKVFDIVEHLLAISAEDEAILVEVFKPHVSVLLSNLSSLVERTKGTTSITDNLGRRQISILSEIAPYLTDSTQAATLLSLFNPLLRKPSKVIPEKLKGDLVSIMRNLLPLVTDLSDPDSPVYAKTYNLLASLFQSLRSRQARTALVATFHSFAEIDPALRDLASLLESLNAYSLKRMDEPDFDRRLTAFKTLNEIAHSSLSSKAWMPILYNMLNFIQDPDELTIRNNSSFAFRRFIDLVCGQDPEYETNFVKVLYPGLKNGLRSKNEMVRAEILGVIAYAVKNCDRISSLQEMRVLLAGGDEEANFFNNIHHVQLHRRTRAIRRLAEHCAEGHLRSATLEDVFIPLVGNFIISAASGDHHLATEAILATGRMAGQLKWGAYHALVQRYLRLIRNKDASERVYVRTLVAILDNFHFPMDDVVEVNSTLEGADNDAGDGEEVEIPDVSAAPAKPMQRSHIADMVNTRLLPSLLNHLETRDETEDTLRIPVAIGIVHVAKHLPHASREAQTTRLITVLSQILRSKSQETRDLTRETLCRIAVIVGPSSVPVIVREMRAALLRGPQLHVLAYATHALFVHITNGDHAKDFDRLDDCVADVAHVSAEVIFGESGKDVQAEEFRTKMREVRLASSKALDTFAIMAKFITAPKIGTLLVPIRHVMQTTETLRIMQQVEDLLRRIAGGLNANAHLPPKELLVLCHSLISQNAKFLQQSATFQKPHNKSKGDAIVQLKRNAGPDADHYANNSFRFVVFGLELFNTAHRRSRFDFQDPNVIARLEPMVAVIGNTLYSNQMQVVIPGLKAAAAIVKCPLKSTQKSLPVFIRQMIDIVKQAGSTESEGAQTALKSLASILRDQPDAQVKEKDLVFLLEVLSPDLEEPARQAAVFSMLRAIVARKFVVPEIYDLMDKVSEIMVTNQSPQVQELCRGVLLQFLLDYPQGKGRLRNHMTFFAKNLSYVYESGRKSVMELLSAILSKFQQGLIREYSDLLFVALVMVIANDDSAKCREMASELIKNLFSRLEDAQRRVVMSHVHSWAGQLAHPQLARVSSQIYSIIIDLLQQDISPYVPSILADINAILQNSASSLEAATTETTDNPMDLDVEWQVPYHALIALSKVLDTSPTLTTETEVKWSLIVSHLLFPHAWVRTASSRLLGVLFAATPVAAPRTDLPDESPFSLLGMEDLAKQFCLQLRSENLDAALSVQVVKNLFHIGKCFCLSEGASAESGATGVDEEEKDIEEDEEEGEQEEEEDADAEGEYAGGDEEPKKHHALPWLFSKLSYQARSAHIARRNKPSSPENWFHQPASVLRWFAAMVSFMEAAQVERFLTHILSPVYRIAEETMIRDLHMDELKTLAIELQELVQSKVGTTKFATTYNRIRQTILGVQRERKTARAIQATANPAAAAKRKVHRNLVKKESRKRKNSVFGEAKGRAKRRKAE